MRQTPPVRHLPAAASTGIRSLLLGSARAGRVLGAVPTALYVELDPGEVVAVVTSDAVRLPCALVIAAYSSKRPLTGVEVGDTAIVGTGHVIIGAKAFSVGRWWSPDVPVHRPTTISGRPVSGLSESVAAVARLLPRLDDELAAPLKALRRWLAAPASSASESNPADPAPAARRHALALLGLGQGLTPAGDDVLAGLLVVSASLAATATPPSPRTTALAAATTDLALRRTTSLSAALLAHAATGRAIPQVSALLAALSWGAGAEEATRHLLAVGHSSGAALAHGIVVGHETLGRSHAPSAEVA